MVGRNGARRGGHPQANGRQSARDHASPALGEQVWIDERLVLAPRNGRWRHMEAAPPEEDEEVLVGQTLGLIHTPDGERVPVRSRFSGRAGGYLLPDGAPVKSSEPVFWLRASRNHRPNGQSPGDGS